MRTPMTRRKKINRREFIAGSSSAIIAATTVPARSETTEPSKSPPSSHPPQFQSPSGSLIPFSQHDLLAQGQIRTFTGDYLPEIAFPLGGIGTGTVSLGGRGDLRDWEIFNRPNKGKALPFTFVALWIRSQGKTPVVKVVEVAPQPPFHGAHGYPRAAGHGLPHMKGARFRGGLSLGRN